MASVNMSGAGGPPMMEKQNSVTMEYFLETSNLDASTAALLRKYDKDGDGSFSKDEVVAIILDLREAMQHNDNLGATNRLFKRLLVAAVCFCILLLASMFGLSYAVAALTAKTEVSSDGRLVSTSGDQATVATNSRAEMHYIPLNDIGKRCVTWDEVMVMVDNVAAGKNVIIETDTDDAGQLIRQVSGSGVLSTHEDVCFTDPADGSQICVVPDPDCTEENSAGRRLSPSPTPAPVMHQRRKLMTSSGCLKGDEAKYICMKVYDSTTATCTECDPNVFISTECVSCVQYGTLVESNRPCVLQSSSRKW